MSHALKQLQYSPPATPPANDAATPTPQPEPRRELTLRALLMGALLGAVLAAGNVYTGLKTAFIDGGSITAALLGFAFFATFQRLTRSHYTARENNITQTTAASASIMGFVLGVSGPIPALSLMGHDYPVWALAVWGIALGVGGVVVAISLRKKLLVAEQLPFPTGSATAEVIETMYAARATALRRARLLMGAAMAAMLLTWFRDARPSLIPQMALFGATVGGFSAAALSVGLSFSPLMIGTGAIVGLRVAASMAIGGLVTWSLIAPWLARSGIVTAASFGACAAWLVWPGLGLLIAGSFLPLILDWRQVARSFGDLPALLRRKNGGVAAGPGESFRHVKLLLVASTTAIVWVGWAVFRLHPLVTIVTLLLAAVLASVCARAAGETDLAPIGAMGMLTQLIFAGNGPAVSLLSGSISAGTASQTAQTLWGLKAGHRLDASARSQIWAQLLGVVVGALVVAPIYLVIVRSYGIGTDAMPAPAAISWKATAEAVRGGFGAMPKYGPLAGAIGLGLGVLLAALSRTRVGRFVPSPAALGMAVLTPASMSCAAFLGGLGAYLVKRARPQTSDASIMSVAAGSIAGESVMGVLIAILIAVGLL